MTALYIILIILAVIMLIFLIPIDLSIRLSCGENGSEGAIIVSYGFIKYKILPAKEKDKPKKIGAKEKKKDKGKKEGKDKAKKDEEKQVSMLVLVKNIYTSLKDDIFALINKFLKKTLRIKELNISSKFGVGDPMYTGIAYGTASSFVYGLVSLADRRMTLDKWNVSLDADFDKACFSAGVYIKIRTRIMYVLSLGISAAVLLLKIQKINRRIRKNG
jgi:hypothetical protein